MHADRLRAQQFDILGIDRGGKHALHLSSRPSVSDLYPVAFEAFGGTIKTRAHRYATPRVGAPLSASVAVQVMNPPTAAEIL